jgi:hypothetical protein
MHKGKYNLADELSAKTGCLIVERSKFLSSVNTHSSKELWFAIGNACGRNSHRCISVPF